MTRLIALIATLLSALPATARDHAPGAGAAIVPVFTAQHSAMRPGEEVTLVACVANGNPHVRHGIRQGDAFRFEFMEGSVLSCGNVTVSPPSPDMAPAEFDCAVDGQSLVLTRIGPNTPWPTGTAFCATVQFVAPPRPSTIVPAVIPVQVGSYAPPEPSLVQLAVATDIGSVGPQGPPGTPGPAGPQGPPGDVGPPGPSFAGGVHHWISTDWSGPFGPPDDVVPGLDQTFSVESGSALYVHLTTILHKSCRSALFRDWRSTSVVIELDGVEMTRHWTHAIETTLFDVGAPLSSHFVASDLAAGTHHIRVRALIDNYIGSPTGGAPYCAGHATDPRLIARLTAIELRQ